MAMLGWVVSGLLGLALGAQLGAQQANGAGSGGVRTRMREAVHDLEAQIGRLGLVERFVLAKLLRREVVARDPAEGEKALTLGERVADRVASFGGSWTFIFLFLGAMAAWIDLNRAPGAFDPYPFILLNLVLSCLAALQAPVIMMSQNRQAAKDRLQAQHDYEVNLKAEMEIITLHAKLDDLLGQVVSRLPPT
jgi:uncharacterized membrane protein